MNESNGQPQHRRTQTKRRCEGGKKNNVHSILNYTDIIFALGEDDEGLGRIQRTSQDNCIKHCSSEDT